MKGHMQDGKFHPHTQYKKGVRKSRDQSAKSTGVKVERKKHYTDIDPIERKVLEEMETSSGARAEVDEENTYIDKEVERRKQKLIDEVMVQIKSDIAFGDVTAIEEFLINMLDEDLGKNINENYNNLWGFIGDERQNKLNRDNEFP